MPKNRKLQNIIGTEHITDAAEAAIAAQASGGATVAFKNVAVAGQDNVVADAATDTLTLVGGSNVTLTTDASADSVTIAAADTVRTVTAGGNTLAAGETLAFTEGTNITISESGGAVTITAAGGGGASPSSANYSFDASFSAIPLHALRPWGTSRSSTGTQGYGTPACRPFIMTHEGGTVNTMYVIVTGGSSGSYRAGIYSDDSGKPGTLLGQADFAYGSGTGVKSATSFFAADGSTSKTITLVKDTQYWMAFVKVSGNLSIRTTDPGRTPHIGLDENSNPANSWYVSIADTTQSNTFEDTWDYANSDLSVFLPGSMWLKMN